MCEWVVKSYSRPSPKHRPLKYYAISERFICDEFLVNKLVYRGRFSVTSHAWHTPPSRLFVNSTVIVAATARLCNFRASCECEWTKLILDVFTVTRRVARKFMIDFDWIYIPDTRQNIDLLRDSSPSDKSWLHHRLCGSSLSISHRRNIFPANRIMWQQCCLRYRGKNFLRFITRKIRFCYEKTTPVFLWMDRNEK